MMLKIDDSFGQYIWSIADELMPNHFSEMVDTYKYPLYTHKKGKREKREKRKSKSI